MNVLELLSALLGGEVMVFASIFVFSFFPPAAGHGNVLDAFSAFAIGIFLLGILPYAVFLLFIKKGKADYALSTREMRNDFYPKIIPFYLAGSIAFWALDDKLMLALSFAWAALYSALYFLNKFTKVSIHTASLAGFVTALVMAFGSVFLLLYPVLAVVAAIRQKLKAHDFWQVLIGSILGAAIFFAVFEALA